MEFTQNLGLTHKLTKSYNFKITPSPATVTALDKQITAGQPAPALSNPKQGEDYTVTGLFGSDTLSITLYYAELSNLSKSVTPDTSETGTYAIVVGFGDPGNANYDVEFISGTLTIGHRPSSRGGGSTTFLVNIPSKAENGTVSVSPHSAEKGDTVTVTVNPDTGYELDTLTATDKNGKELKLMDKGDGKYTFTMPGSKVTVTANFKQISTEAENPFTDISKNDYFYDSVLWAVEEGITSGTSDTTFSPNVSCTRAQMVTFLWRASGTPEIGTTNPFSDVSADAYYYDAVLWAVEQGITGGTGGEKFSPDAPCTRAQMAVFLWRAAGSPAPESDESIFTDVPGDIWYVKAVQWAYEQSITSGTGGGKFSPNVTCTRAQMVQMLKNASDTV